MAEESKMNMAIKSVNETQKDKKEPEAKVKVVETNPKVDKPIMILALADSFYIGKFKEVLDDCIVLEEVYVAYKDFGKYIIDPTPPNSNFRPYRMNYANYSGLAVYKDKIHFNLILNPDDPIFTLVENNCKNFLTKSNV